MLAPSAFRDIVVRSQYSAMAMKVEAQRLAVYTHLEGNFPGGQVDLTNRFTLRGDLITALEIVPTAVTS